MMLAQPLRATNLWTPLGMNTASRSERNGATFLSVLVLYRGDGLKDKCRGVTFRVYNFANNEARKSSTTITYLHAPEADGGRHVAMLTCNFSNGRVYFR